MVHKQSTDAVPGMEAARKDVLAFLHFAQEQWGTIWSINPLKRLNLVIKRRTNVVGIFPNDTEVVAFYWTVLAPDIVNPGREEQGSVSV